MSSLRRPTWLQFHLSTAMVMMCVAGVFLGLNTVPRTSTHIKYFSRRLFTRRGDSPPVRRVFGLELIDCKQDMNVGWPEIYRHRSSESSRYQNNWIEADDADASALARAGLRESIEYDMQLFQKALPNSDFNAAVDRFRFESDDSKSLNIHNIVINVVTGLSILLILAILCEKFSRRPKRVMSPLQGSVA